MRGTRTLPPGAIALGRVAALAVAIGGWQLGSILLNNPLVFPSVPATAHALRVLGGESQFWRALWDTTRITLIGESLAIAVGIALGIVIGISRLADAFLSGYVNVFNAMPRIALIPVIIILVGLGQTARITIVFISAIFPMIINTETGIKSVDPDYRELARSYCSSRTQELVHISIPAAVPSMLAGLRLSVGHGVIGAITAELLISVGGIGGLLALNSNLLATPTVYALVVVLAALGLTFVYLGNLPYRLAARRKGKWVRPK
jgi:ABC-type nitrate/sulfonate/bicarbonate transport system permease component